MIKPTLGCIVLCGWLMAGAALQAHQGRGGFFHSYQMHVVERFTRQGNAILYDVTIEDPVVLLEPWMLPTRTLAPKPDPDAGLLL